MGKIRYDYLTINSVRFKIDTLETREEPNIRPYETIHTAYGRPSATKVSIWHYWEKWFSENGGYCWVSSHNSNFFTIEGIVQSELGYPYYCRITPSHHYAWKIA